jgi:hypothetical protein
MSTNAGRNGNPRTPWKVIERLYRAGILSIREIARETNTPENNIRYHAKKYGWSRDLTDAVRQASRAKMIENLAQGVEMNKGAKKNANEEVIRLLTGSTDEQIIEEAAKTQVEVVRQHQKTLGAGHSLAMRMLNELDATTTHHGELTDMIKSTIAPRRQGAVLNAISLGQRATTMRDLAQAVRLWVVLERQAFSIAEDKDKSVEAKKLDEMTSEQLRAEIVQEAQELGIELNKNFGNGVAKANGSTH